MAMSEFFNLVSPEEARAQILGAIDPLGDFEIIPTESAIGRVTVDDIVSPQMLPEFRRSTHDGYAVMAQDTFGASESLPTYLNLIGEVLMGQVASMTIQPGEAVSVHTGGMIPNGADAVVMLENTQAGRDRRKRNRGR
jgi:molybdopterin molybdotransferase